MWSDGHRLLGMIAPGAADPTDSCSGTPVAAAAAASSVAYDASVKSVRDWSRYGRERERARPSAAMFSCKSYAAAYACGLKIRRNCSDSDDDSSYGFKASGNRTRAVSTGDGRPRDDDDDDEDYHIYGNVTFGYKPILKTRLSSAASSTRRRAPVKRTVSFSGVEPSATDAFVRRRLSLRPPPPCYAVAVRRASSFSVTRRNAAEIVARRQRMPLPHEDGRVVVVDVHRESDFAGRTPPLVVDTLPVSTPTGFVFPLRVSSGLGEMKTIFLLLSSFTS